MMQVYLGCIRAAAPAWTNCFLSRWNTFMFIRWSSIPNKTTHSISFLKCPSYWRNETVHVSVEWLFGEINYFKSIDFKRQLSIQLSPVAKIYIVCALLQNSSTCLYGNKVSGYFEAKPPSLEDFFPAIWHAIKGCTKLHPPLWKMNFGINPISIKPPLLSQSHRPMFKHQHLA